MLEGLQTFPTPRNLKITTIVFFVAFLVLTFVMKPYTDATAAAGVPGVVDLELAFTGARAREIVNLWGFTGLKEGQFDLNLIDFAYMPAYAFFIGGTVLLTTRPLPSGRQKQFGFVAALMPFGAWLSDAIENFNINDMLTTEPVRNITDTMALSASIAATIKFTLLAIAIVVFAANCIRLLVIKRRTGNA